MRFWVRARKEERKQASSEMASTEGEAEEATEEGPEMWAQREGGPG